MPVHTVAVLNPLSGVPLLGYLVILVDSVATQLGMTLWLRAFLELVLAFVGCYVLLRLVTKRLLPWLGGVLVRPVVEVVDLLRVLLLLPDLGASRALRKLGRTPYEVVYAYGTAVVTVADRMQEAARTGLSAVAVTRRIHGTVLVLVIAGSFLIWNSQTCATGTGTSCISPVTAWTTSFKAAFDTPAGGTSSP